MKKINDFLIFIGIALLLFISYSVDEQVSLFFESANMPFFDIIFSVITNFGVAILFMLAIPSFILYKKNKKLVYLLLVTFVISIVLAFVIKLIVARQRPLEVLSFTYIKIISYSFPSMHSMVVFSFLPALIKYLPKKKNFWIFFAISVAFSRIYFNFHFLSDVVFGAVAGYIIGDYLLELYDKGKLWKK